MASEFGVRKLVTNTFLQAKAMVERLNGSTHVSSMKPYLKAVQASANMSTSFFTKKA